MVGIVSLVAISGAVYLLSVSFLFSLPILSNYIKKLFEEKKN